MESLISVISETLITIAIVIIGYYGSKLCAYVVGKIESAKELDNLGIIELITKKAVEYAEEEFGGGKGEEKKEFAIKKATEFLNEKGIEVSEDVIKAGIASGVQQLHKLQGKYDSPATVESQTEPVVLNLSSTVIDKDSITATVRESMITKRDR